MSVTNCHLPLLETAPFQTMDRFEEYTFFQKIIIGLQASIIELPISIIAQLTTLKIMDSFGVEATETQNAQEVLDVLIEATSQQ